MPMTATAPVTYKLLTDCRPPAKVTVLPATEQEKLVMAMPLTERERQETVLMLM